MFAHTNGASGRLYYPEILPPGVALLDYDADGDLDVYLPQGRALADAALAPAPAAQAAAPGGARLYRNDLDGRWRWHARAALHGCDRREWARRAGLRVRRRHRRHRQRRVRRSLRDGLRRLPPVSQQRQRHVQRRHGGERRGESWRLRGIGRVRRSRPRRLAGSVRRQQRDLPDHERHRLSRSGWRARLLPAADLRRATRPSLPQPRTRTLPRHQRHGPARPDGSSGLGRVHGRLRRRRLDGHLRRQRRRTRLPVDERTRRHVARSGSAGRAWP